MQTPQKATVVWLTLIDPEAQKLLKIPVTPEVYVKAHDGKECFGLKQSNESK